MCQMSHLSNGWTCITIRRIVMRSEFDIAGELIIIS